MSLRLHSLGSNTILKAQYDMRKRSPVVNELVYKVLNCNSANEKRCKQSSFNIRKLNILEQALRLI